MKLRYIKIERFRGIKKLEWHLESDFVCLIGPGDSRKSTILDAIDYALTPRGSITFDDSDFYNLNTSEPISILVSVGQVPKELMTEKKYGLCLTGYCKGELHDELQNGDDEVISIRLTIDSSLEPEWVVINKQHPEGFHISGRDRERLGIIRLGGLVNYHLSWRRGTVLSRLTGELDNIDGILAEATRAARQSIPVDKLVNFKNAAKQVQELGKKLGVAPFKTYEPNLDIGAVNIGDGGFTLHDGQVPVRRGGLGARRLLIMALQSELASSGSIALIDEFEHGLEPHRIRHLLRLLKEWAKSNNFGQIILTTHSPVVAEELPERLHIVQTIQESTTVREVSGDLVATIRRTPESLLGRKVIVYEGKTEFGICRALDEYWATQGVEPFACCGVVPVEGGGNQAPTTSIDIAKLNYQVAFLGDSDTKDIQNQAGKMKQNGVEVLVWEGSLATEQRVTQDLPWQGVIEVVRLALSLRDEKAVKDEIANRLGKKPGDLGPIESWVDTPEFRKAIGDAAKTGEWFKRIDNGEEFGRIITKYLSSITNTDLAKKLQSLMEWIKK